MKIDIVHATEHMPDQYRDYLEGYRAIRLIDEAGEIRAELVWRLASRWNALFEIKELGVFSESDRRKGWATQLLDAALQDMRDFLHRVELGYRPWRVYLFCETRNQAGRGFYEARGFDVAAEVKGLYGPGQGEDAIMYTKDLSEYG